MYRKGYFYRDHHNASFFNNPEVCQIKVDLNSQINSSLRCSSYSGKIQIKKHLITLKQNQRMTQSSLCKYLNSYPTQSSQKTIKKLALLYQNKYENGRNSSSSSFKLQKSKRTNQNFQLFDLKNINNDFKVKKKSNQIQREMEKQKRQNIQRKNQSIWNQKQVYQFNNSFVFSQAIKSAFIPSQKVKRGRSNLLKQF